MSNAFWISGAFLFWAAGMLVQWGIFKGQGVDHGRRLEVLERQMTQGVLGRLEYEARQQDILNRLKRIEDKLDRNNRSGGS